MNAQLVLVEGEAAIEKEIMRHVDRMSRVGIGRLLIELTQTLALDPRPVVHAWMNQVAHRKAAANKLLPTTSLDSIPANAKPGSDLTPEVS